MNKIRSRWQRTGILNTLFPKRFSRAVIILTGKAIPDESGCRHRKLPIPEWPTPKNG
jgi:hypothetical protein